MLNSHKIIVLSIFSLAIINSYSQGFSFLNTVTSSSSGYQASIRAVKVDQLGNKYIAGNFDISATIKNTTIIGNSKDIFFGKLDPLGNPIWIKTAGGPDSDQAMDIELDNQGGLYISGLFSGAANFDGNTVTAIQPSSNAITMSDNFLVKYDTSGNFQWIKTGATTDNDFNNNVNGYNNNTFNYYGKSKIKFKNGNIYLMASNRVSGSQLGAINAAGRQFDGITLPNTQAPGGGGFYGYKYLNSFILKTDVNGTNSWLTPIYCNTTSDFDAVISLDFEINSNDHVIAQYYYSSNGCKIGGQSTPNSISSFSTPSANFPRGALMILELDGSGFYYNVYKIENALASFNAFFGFGNALDYISYGLSIDNSDNVYFAFNNFSNGNFNQTIAGINVPENTNTLVKLNPNFIPTNCNLLNTFPSQSQNSFPISALEVKENQLIFGGTLDGTVNLNNSTFSRSDEITFVNMDTNLSSVNWVTSTSNSSVLQVDGSGANSAFPEKYSLGIYDLSIGNENQAVFCGNIGPQYRSFGDYTTTTNQLNDAFLTEIIPCIPVFSQILPLNPVICGAGNSATLNANVNPGISYNWVSNGSSTSSSNSPFYTTTNVGDFSLITDSLGCKDTSNVVNVTLAPLPNVTVPQSTFTACFSGGPTVVPAGSPSGGVWSGLGMVNDSVFDPTVLGPGPSLITYTYTNTQGCSDDGIRIANTVQTPPLILSNNLPSFCEGDGPYSLGATVNPSGGNYFGPGVSGTTFNPVNAGVGTHLIRYKYSVAQNCEDSVDFYLVVNASPAINYPDYDSLCENISSTPLFSASPFGGTYSGPFVIGNNFYPFFSGAGSFPITYTVTENGCISSSTKNIQIDANINAQLSSISDFCVNDIELALDFGLPTGGNYKIDGFSKDSLKPAELGIGTHTIEYELTNSCGTSVDIKTFEIFGLPNVSAGTDAAVCIGESVTLNGIGASTYIWDNNITNSAAFSPTSTLTYRVIGVDINGCINTDSIKVTVNDLPNVDAGNDTSICDGESLALTASGALTYNWDNNITNATAFTPISTTLYTVTGTDNNGCNNTDQVTITINNNPLVSLSSFTPICNANSSTVPLTGGFPTGGNYNGLGVSNNNFSPSVSGAGFHNITYSFSDSNGCSSSDNKILVVDTNNVNISLASFGNLCEDADSLVLSGGTPSGGFYSGNSVNNGVFYPDSSGSGSFSITYSYLEANTCIASTNSTITVSSLPIVTQDSLNPICLNNSPFVLNGSSPAGGFYSGNGISNGIFNPQITGIGNFNINYIFTDSLGCINNSETSLTVKPLPNTTLSSINDLCIDATNLVLTSGIPLGGTYSGNGVNNGIFYPDSSGTGNHIITYTGELNGCFLSDSQTITVNPLPTLSFGSIPELCVNDSLVLNFMSPTGGNYSGNNTNNGIFYSNNTNIGINNINYTYTDFNSCSNNQNISLLVNDLTNIYSSNSLINDFCVNDSISALNNYLPIGGTYFGNGISNNLFDPSIAGVGQQLVNYEFIDSNGCLSSIIDTLNVNALPIVNLTSIEICENSPSVALNNGLPTGGTYSGIGISNGFFDPININPGNSTLTYLVTDSNNCSNIDTSFIKINPNPIVSLNLMENLCRNEGLITLNGGQPIGGNYSGSGITGNILNTTALNTGINYVTYSYTDTNSCSSTSVDSLNILQEPTISISGDSILCFGDTSVVSAIGGLNYLWNNGDTSNTTTSLAFNSFFLSAIGTDSNGCQNIDSIFVTVNDLPQVTINAPDTLCSDSLTTINVISSANQFLWNNNNTNAFIEIGPFNNGDDPSYFVTVTDSNGCYNSDSTIIIIENCDVSEVHNLNNMEVSVYPNPNNGYFTIELDNHLNEEIDITFISPLGQIVNQQKFNSNIINFSAPYLSSGIYSLIIKSKNQYLIKKVVIQ